MNQQAPSEAAPSISPSSNQRPRARGRGHEPAIVIEPTTRPRPVPDAASLRFGQVFTDHMFLCEHRGRAWHAPRVVARAPLALDPAAAGLHYGQAMFEGLKAVRGIDGKLRLFQVDRHIQRMIRGAGRLCMPAPDARLLRRGIEALARLDQHFAPTPGTALYLRPTLIATEAFLGVRPAEQYLLFVIASPLAAYFGSGAPLRLRIEERHVRAAPGGLGAVKAAANYAASLRAAEEARAAGYAQVLWTDAGRHQAIEEAGTMNVFVHIGDEIVTPPLRGTILAGVTREAVMALLARAGRPVTERVITADEILEARRCGRLHEMFGTGTAAGVVSIGELGWRGETIVVGDGGEGALARHLGPRLRELQTGVAEDGEGWMTEVS